MPRAALNAAQVKDLRLQVRHFSGAFELSHIEDHKKLGIENRKQCLPLPEIALVRERIELNHGIVKIVPVPLFK